ncbi:hypothetical protein GBAR_LOCUS31138 [Geodia barretti]|uniref:UBX domain-containing protein n=1 Tax=Geodia barretti TaxID=519541 RepID=A0AA35TZ36_GEOBA|nr:hypothetical protein GBAR_LOCUS31138 [Geodia barretti]
MTAEPDSREGSLFSLLQPPAPTGSLASVAGGGEEKATSASGAKSHASSSSTCRLQIRLPNGKVLRPSLPASAPLSEVAQFVISSHPSLSTVTLVQG